MAKNSIIISSSSGSSGSSGSSSSTNVISWPLAEYLIKHVFLCRAFNAMYIHICHSSVTTDINLRTAWAAVQLYPNDLYFFVQSGTSQLTRIIQRLLPLDYTMTHSIRATQI